MGLQALRCGDVLGGSARGLGDRQVERDADPSFAAELAEGADGGAV